ncbi:MAG TPA: hypothetical protein VIP28_07310 [Nocardioides sp.]
MITITANNGTRGIGSTVESACRDLAGHSRKLAVRRGPGWFVPVEEASAEDVRRSGALWVNKDRSWKIAHLVNEVTEAP